MKTLILLCLISIFIPVSSQDLKSKKDGGIVDTENSKYVQFQSTDLSSVNLTHGFWADRNKLNSDVSFIKLWDLAVDPNKGHVIQNFEIAAGLKQGNFVGTFWQDEWLYKWIETACYMLAQDPNYIFKGKSLKSFLDEVIDLIAKAQAKDGYIATQIQTTDLGRFTNFKHHEFYVMGHLLTAAAVHYRITGKKNLLEVAEKAGHFCYEWFKTHKGDPATIDFPNNPSIIMGAVELYRATNNKEYLELANLVVDSRGASWNGKMTKNALTKRVGGLENNQNWIPLRQETEVIGHAVFFTYLYAGAADIYMENGDKTLLVALERLWKDLTEKKMYVTGGVSNSFGSLPTRNFAGDKNRKIIMNDEIEEGVDKPYNLTNYDAYNEVCGMCGNMMWNWRMLLATGEPKYADIMELSFYNSIISGVKLTGDEWIYCNGLGWHGDEQEMLNSSKQTWNTPGPRLICCPTNILRNIACYNGYLFTTHENAIQVQQYAGSKANLKLKDGKEVSLKLETNYPWEGKVKLTVDRIQGEKDFELAFRIPSWSTHNTCRLNGQDPGLNINAQSYLKIDRSWKEGDVIELEFDMDVKLLVANPKTEFDRNQVAVKRGPLVYCLEEHEIPGGSDFFNIAIDPQKKWNVEFEKDFLHGIVTLQTNATLRNPSSKPPYGQYGEYMPGSQNISIKLIPYYAWRNRGLDKKMEVWLPIQ
ncbi:MAG: glycoside hydrolase family 127 protein [Bacteroidia bacterium]|nr:glycoside hydrolase family 127 protein [Bacteroidia bacterium]